MNTLEVERSPETLQCHQNCKAYLGQLESELETILAQQKAIANPKESSKLNVSVNDLRNKIEQVNRMLEFPPGSWVRNGSNKPGKVIDLVIAGKVPEVHVQWSGTNVPVPEQPLKLKLVEPADLEYIWNGDRFPKLVRRIDRQECNEIPVLQENLNRLQICQNISVEHGNDHDLVRGYQLQLTYCKKRIEYLKRPYRDRVLISQIRRDGGTQQRVNLNHEVVNEYAEAMRFGAEFPPIKLRYDGENYWLTDGFHTTEAAWSLHKKIIEAEITWGTQRDAILDSVGANASHGLRRSNADKRKAVTAMLEDKDWNQWSDREIARRCNVSNTFVSKLRSDLTVNVDSDNPKNDKQTAAVTVDSDNQRNYKDRYGNVSQMNIDNIGSDNKQEELSVKPKNHNHSIDNQDSKTAYQDSKTVKQDNSCPDCQYQVGQLVRINPPSDRPDKRLVGHYGTVAIITAINPASVDIKTFGHRFSGVSLNDLTMVREERLPVFCVNPSLEEYTYLLSHFDNKEDVLKAAIAARSLEL